MDFGVDSPKPAVIAIDLHRGHLDPAVATMPLAADRAAVVVEANRRFFDGCRAAGIPIVHLVTTYRDADEIRSNPFWRTRADNPTATRKNVERHNIEGMPGCRIMPQLHADGDWIVNTKKRYDCFVASDLDFMLRRHGINTLLITGVNTNSCVLATTVRANVMDYAAVCIEDCVDTMDGPAAHEAALTCVRAAFGWVMTGDEALRTFGRR
ncbi:cysteine hydrolase family protein [Azospirillum brasilense]|uniref:cysteine hydrolase family protein n=1 Tax=Azospirillum brasilense TaxID=192 RepID=UPI00190C09C8|nr:cysteine hydrolase [Azospirillum brasilense]